MTGRPKLSKEMLVASVVTGINVPVATSFSVAGLVSAQPILLAGVAATQGASIFAMYAAARTIPLAVFAFVGLYQHDIGKTLGPLVLMLLQFYAINALYRSASD